MIPFDEFKASLGTEARELTDEEIERIRVAFDRIADIAFDQWSQKRSTTCASVSI